MSTVGLPKPTWLPSVRLQAPGKLNLFLEITAKRRDGYHELLTLMVTVSLYDTVVVSPEAGGTCQLVCDWSTGRRAMKKAAREPAASVWEELPEGQQNLAYRAAQWAVGQSAGMQGVRIWLWKRIPSLAGFGGASSDAAAVLKAAAYLRTELSHERLFEAAAALGSDVAFFVNGPAALATGRGEKLQPVRPVPLYHFVVVRPVVGLSTAEVYRRCRLPSQPRSIQPTLEAFCSGDPVQLGKTLFNRLQEAARQINPWIARLEKLLARCGFLGFQMTGSGSSFFGLCRHARHARRAAAWLRSMGIGAVYHVTTVARGSLGTGGTPQGDCHGNHRGAHQVDGEHG
ncbi:MAG: 4-diphosphocytidyl-2-C-methyl-D-erythritol kinase [Pirellulaceae bacterium]|nr:MAG: 4-diphosphocytidyl-2-C-methyl-D-erythritol kinase [Pirellulaceae bacterium]